MNRKIDVGGTLSQVFSIYGANAGILLPVAFWLFLVVAIVNGVIAGSLALLPIALAVSTIAGTLYQGMVVGLVRDVQDGRRDFSAGELFNSAMPVVLPLIGAGILSGIAIGIGTVLFIVPGLFLLTIWAVIAPVIVVEHSSVMDSFGRSRQLVRGNGWPVFGAIFVAFLIVFIGGLIFAAIATSIADGALVRIVFSAIASTITAPISALVAAVLYFRLRGVEEAAGPPAAGPPLVDPAAPPAYAPPSPPAPPAPPPPPPPPAPPAG
jgi:hypothetical protein